MTFIIYLRKQNCHEIQDFESDIKKTESRRSGAIRSC